MRELFGILGYIIIILSAAFLDIPFIGLLAMLTFLVGLILLIIFFLKFLGDDLKYEWFYSTLIIFGVIILVGALGYSSVEYNEYLVSVNRGEELSGFSGFNWNKILIIACIVIISSLIILAGIWKDSKDKIETIISWLPTLFLIPISILLIKLLELMGAPLSA